MIINWLIHKIKTFFFYYLDTQIQEKNLVNQKEVDQIVEDLKRLNKHIDNSGIVIRIYAASNHSLGSLK